MHRPAALLIALCAPAVAAAQPARCTPDVAIDRSVPPRLVARLRALAGRVEVPGQRCPSVQFSWSAQRLSVHVELHDGRVARRTLRSLDDALPTLLAVLAAPPDDDYDDDAEGDAEPVDAAPQPAPPAAFETDPSRPPVLLPAPVAPASPAVRPRTFGFSLLYGYGATPGGGGASQWRAEFSLARPSWALALRGAHAEAWGREERRREDAAVAALRLRYGVARWRFEFGGSAGVAWRRVEREGQRDAGSLAARVGVEGVAAFRVWRTLSALAWAEAWADLALYEGRAWQAPSSPLSLAGGLGLRWEVP